MTVYVPIPVADLTLMFDEPDVAAPTVAVAMKAAVEEGKVLILNTGIRGLVVVNLAAVGPLRVQTTYRAVGDIIDVGDLSALA